VETKAENLVTEIRTTNYVHFIREHPVMFCHGSPTYLGSLETLSRGFSELWRKCTNVQHSTYQQIT